MSRRRIGWQPLLVAMIAVVLAGCNLFNLSGAGDASDPDALVERGEDCMRSRDFGCAYDAFSRALAQDSSKSLAWHGLCKASIARDSVPITELLRRTYGLGAVGDSTMPFLGENDSVKNRFYRPLIRLQGLIMAFRRRDSLGRLDGLYASSREDVDLLVASNLGLVLKLSDLNRDTVVDVRDNLLKGAFDSIDAGGLKPGALSPDSFLATSDMTGRVDTQKVADFNTFLQGVNDDVETNRTILKQMGGTSFHAPDSGSAADEELDGQIDRFLEAAAGSIVFWKINDSIDDDGDGCVDEEVWGDNLDNDGDGLVDEDGRVAYLFPSDPLLTRNTLFANAPDDGVLNDRVRIVGGDVRFVSGIDDLDSGVFVRAGTRALASQGRSKAFQNLSWVNLLDGVNRPFYDDAVAKYPDETPMDWMDRARNAIRLHVLSFEGAERKKEGETHVGGCWSRASIE